MRQWTIDAFATAPFRGNPACVVEPFARWPSTTWMQSLAAENNQAETAFLLRTEDPARFGLRWFTPAVEAPLCGHATLASAHALFEEMGLTAPLISFETLSGVLKAQRKEGRIKLDFPAQAAQRVTDAPDIAAAIQAEPLELWTSHYPVAIVKDERTVREITVDMAAIARLRMPGVEVAGTLCVAALADPDRPYQVVSRFFAPGSGIPEDPTTGSAHCILAPLFAEKLGRSSLAFHQAYPGRGGDLDCEVISDRVRLRGQAVTVIDSQLKILVGA